MTNQSTAYTQTAANADIILDLLALYGPDIDRYQEMEAAGDFEDGVYNTYRSMVENYLNNAFTI